MTIVAVAVRHVNRLAIVRDGRVITTIIIIKNPNSKAIMERVITNEKLII
jgi:hypothetical protein